MVLRILNKIVVLVIIFALVSEQSGFAQVAGPMGIPSYINGYVPQDKFRPLQLRSLTFDQISNDFNLYLDKGDLLDLKPKEIRENAAKLSEYFQIGLRLPNSAFWVNLRPDAPDQIIDPWLEKTDLGKVMLEADLQLKKDMADFTSPRTPEGKNYWDDLYKKAEELFGRSEMTIPTLTRPWIVPGEILIRQTKENAYIYKATLKVMLEQDYLQGVPEYKFDDPRLKTLNEYSSQLIRREILPKLTREVNSSKKYAGLRQVYYSLILAQWFKQSHIATKSLVTSKIDSYDLDGLTSRKNWSKDKYFKAYKRSFSQGEYRLQETNNRLSGTSIRQYTSGGLLLEKMNIGKIDLIPSNARILKDGGLSDTLKPGLIEVRGADIISTDQQQPGKDDDNAQSMLNGIFHYLKLKRQELKMGPERGNQVKQQRLSSRGAEEEHGGAESAADAGKGVDLDGGTQAFYIDEALKNGINTILKDSEDNWEQRKDDPVLKKDLSMLNREIEQIKDNAVNELLYLTRKFNKRQAVSYLNIVIASPDFSAYAKGLSAKALTKLKLSLTGKPNTAKVTPKDGGDIKETRVLVLKDLLQQLSKNSFELRVFMAQTNSDYKKEPGDADIERISSVIQKSMSVLPEEGFRNILLRPAEGRDTRKKIDWSLIEAKEEIGPEDADLVLELAKNYFLRLRRKVVELGLGYDEILPEHFLALARSSEEDIRDFILEMLPKEIEPKTDQIERVRKVLISYVGRNRMLVKEMDIVKAANDYLWRMFARKLMMGEEDRQDSLFTAPWVLVVDDNIPAATEIAVTYRSLGFRVLIEESVKRAKETYEWGEDNGIVFDLVSTDRDMPGESGFDLANWIKRRTPVILLTGGVFDPDEPVAVDPKGEIVAKISKTNYERVLPGVIKDLNIFSGDPMLLTSGNPAASRDGGKPIDPAVVKTMVEKNIALFNANPKWMEVYLNMKSNRWNFLHGYALPSGEISDISSRMFPDAYSKQMRFMFGYGHLSTIRDYSQVILTNESLIKKVLEGTFEGLDKQYEQNSAGPEVKKDALRDLELVKEVKDLAAEHYSLSGQFLDNALPRGPIIDNEPDDRKEKMVRQKKVFFEKAVNLQKIAEAYNVPALEYGELNALDEDDLLISLSPEAAKKSYWYFAISAAEARVQHEYLKDAFNERRFFSVNRLQEIMELALTAGNPELLDGGVKYEDRKRWIELDIAALNRIIDNLNQELITAAAPEKEAIQEKINKAAKGLALAKNALEELEARKPETWDNNRIKKGEQYLVKRGRSDYFEQKYGQSGRIVIVEGPHQQLLGGWYGDVALQDPNDKKSNPENIIISRAYSGRMRDDLLPGDDPNEDEVFVVRIYSQGMVYRELVHKTELEEYDPESLDGGTESQENAAKDMALIERAKVFYSRFGIVLAENITVAELRVMLADSKESLRRLMSEQPEAGTEQTTASHPFWQRMSSKALLVFLLTSAAGGMVIGKKLFDTNDQMTLEDSYQALLKVYDEAMSIDDNMFAVSAAENRDSFESPNLLLNVQHYGGPNWASEKGVLYPAMDLSQSKYLKVDLYSVTEGQVIIQLLDDKIRDGQNDGVTGPIAVHAGDQTLWVPMSEISGVDLTRVSAVVVHHGQKAWLVNLNNENIGVILEDAQFTNEEPGIFEELNSWFEGLGKWVNSWYGDLEQKLNSLGEDLDQRLNSIDQALSQDNDQGLKKDGGTDQQPPLTTGGVDFRALPAVVTPMVNPAAGAGLISLNDLDKQWSEIQSRIYQGEMPYPEIELYVRSCCGQKAAAKQLERVSEGIINILKMEEDRALLTAPELKEILACLG